MCGVTAATMLSTQSDHHSVCENGKDDEQTSAQSEGRSHNARSEGEKP